MGEAIKKISHCFYFKIEDLVMYKRIKILLLLICICGASIYNAIAQSNQTKSGDRPAAGSIQFEAPVSYLISFTGFYKAM